MTPLLRPLFRYRKFKIAGELLEDCADNWIVDTGFVDELRQTHQKHNRVFARYPIRNFIYRHKNVNPERLLEAVDLLAANGHVEKEDSADLLQVWLRCTVAGERANNDGYYFHEVIKRKWALIAAVFGSAGILTIGIAEWQALLTLLRKLF